MLYYYIVFYYDLCLATEGRFYQDGTHFILLFIHLNNILLIQISIFNVLLLFNNNKNINNNNIYLKYNINVYRGTGSVEF